MINRLWTIFIYVMMNDGYLELFERGEKQRKELMAICLRKTCCFSYGFYICRFLLMIWEIEWRAEAS